MIDHPILSDAAKSGMRLGVERFQSFMNFLENPERSFQSFHIAGTNGKGSVASLVDSVLGEAGHTVGCFTSPHLQRVNERIKVNGVEISDEELDSLLKELYRSAQNWAYSNEVSLCGLLPLTYFELVTALAFVYFQRKSVDVAVVEVGLGGRHDATVVIDPIVSLIVSIGFDHMDQLGTDLASIASEKAGILRPDVPVVTGSLSQDPYRVIRMMSGNVGSPIYALGKEFHLLHQEGERFSFRFNDVWIEDIQLSLIGAHQQENATVALAALYLAKERFPFTMSDLRKGMLAKHPGRMEWLSDNLLVDCAHNQDGASRLASYLRSLPRTAARTLLLGTSADKDIRSIAVQLAPHFDRILTTRCSHPRAVSAGDVATMLVGMDVPVLPAGSIENALKTVDLDEGLVVVAGSVFLVGAVRDLLGRL
jgi:dihydrofolate synthase / folylpolyglutamate synthase